MGRSFEADLDRLSTGLIEEVRKGTDGAWDRLVQQFEQLVLAVPHELGLSEADCEEVFQLTWISLYQQIHYIRRPGALAAWIVTTARRQAMRLVTRQRRERPGGDGVLSAAAGTSDDGHDPLEQTIELEERQLVQ